MSGTGGPDDRDGDRSRGASPDPRAGPQSYEFGYGAWSVDLGSVPAAGEFEPPIPAPAAPGPRESLLKSRMRARRAAERAGRSDAALSFGGRPSEPPPIRPAAEAAAPEGDGHRPQEPTRRSAPDDDEEVVFEPDAQDTFDREDEEAAAHGDAASAEDELPEPRPRGRREREVLESVQGRRAAYERDPSELTPMRPPERQRRHEAAQGDPVRRRDGRRAAAAPPPPQDDDDLPVGRPAPDVARPAVADVRADRTRQRPRPSPAPADAPRVVGASGVPRDPAAPDEDSSRRTLRAGGTGSVVIEERLFEILDWSSGGIAIRSDSQYYRVGDVRQLELEIDLGDYAVNLDLEGEVVNRTSERTGWRFLNPTETQRQVLRALVHAAQGRPFAAPRALPSRGDVAEPLRAPPTPQRPRRKNRPLSALMSLPFNAAVIGVVALLGIGVLDRRPPESAAPAAVRSGVVQAMRAAVAVERVPLPAPATGRLLGWVKQPGEPAAPGEVVATIAPDGGGGEPVLVTSPCDCILARTLVRDGAIKAGDALAALYPRTAEAYVQAVFLAADAPEVGDTASVALAYTSERFDGTVVRVGRPPGAARSIGLSDEQLTAPGTVFARLRTTPPVPAALAGDPAVVTMRPDGPRQGADTVSSDDPRQGAETVSSDGPRPGAETVSPDDAPPPVTAVPDLVAPAPAPAPPAAAPGAVAEAPTEVPAEDGAAASPPTSPAATENADSDPAPAPDAAASVPPADPLPPAADAPDAGAAAPPPT